MKFVVDIPSDEEKLKSEQRQDAIFECIQRAAFENWDANPINWPEPYRTLYEDNMREECQYERNFGDLK